MSAKRMGLYQLLKPQLLLGFTFPDYIDRYLSILGIDELRIASDESGIVYTGKASFTGDADASPVRQHRDPSGAVFEWQDVTIDFRLTIPRDGASFIHDAVTNNILPDIDTLFNRFGSIEGSENSPTEYPGVRFRLELMLTALTFHMGKEWKPGMLDQVHHNLVLSNDPEVQGQDVRFVLPRVVMQYEQGDDLSKPPTFALNSWGSSGFDAPHDLAEGELVQMIPPIAIHESGRFGFGVDQVFLDLSSDHTPPEILQFFGTDDEFQGIYIKSLRFYYKDQNKDLGVNIAVNDALISFVGQISLEASIDLFTNIALTGFTVSVHFFDGPTEITFTRGNATDTEHQNVLTGGSATVPNTAIIQVHVSGGFPSYKVSVKLDSTELWDTSRNDARISPDMPETLQPPGNYTLVITVDDQASPVPNHYSHSIALTVTAAQIPLPAEEQDGAVPDQPPQSGERQQATFVINPADQPLPPGYNIGFIPSTSGISEYLIVEGGNTPRVVIRNGSEKLTEEVLNDNRYVRDIDVPDGVALDVTVEYPEIATDKEETFTLFFDLDKPYHPNSPNSPRWNMVLPWYVSDNPDTDTQLAYKDTEFAESTGQSGNPGLKGAAALRYWIRNQLYGVSPVDKRVKVNGYASFEHDQLEKHDQELSEYRRDIAVNIIGADATVTEKNAYGHKFNTGYSKKENRKVTITGVVSPATASKTVRGVLSRPARSSPAPLLSTPVVRSTPAPPAQPSRRPAVIKRLSFRIRLERNVPVLIEFSGEVDLETDLEQRLRTESNIPEGKLELKQRPGASANPNPQDGVVDFKLNVTYDTSTKQLIETLSIGASPDDINGIAVIDNPRSGPATPINRFKDICGALLVFAPIINSAVDSIDPNSAGDWTEIGVSLAVPIAIGALDVFRTQKIMLYGGELKFRQFLPSGSDPLRFTDASIIFDYGVEFGITIDLLGINTERPLKVRYQAVGFNLHFEGGDNYQPIFDTSKGYEIDLSDPGLFNLPSSLGNVLKILAARIARFNPLTLELDFALKVDLGIITVDRFMVKVPLDPPDVPMILPTGAHVNIPSTLVGSGYVNIIKRTVDGIEQNGIEGTIDLSIVPAKIRISASLGLVSLEDKVKNRKAVAVFVGLIVEFPSPIVLFSTGLGIYGFNGLFGMHYMRAEDTRAPGDSVSPALRWLIKAEGEPSKLINSTGQNIWIPQFDRWSFGIGVILGSLDTGFVLNLRGTFVLELPGPRILIFVKVQFISKLPDLKPAADLQLGILGVVDLDFNLGQLTIGVMADLSIKDLISIQVPIEIFFKFKDLSQWHFYLGTIPQPATALILNLVRARGYFMAAGDRIDGFPKGDGTTITLPGIAVATGLEASIVFGDEGTGLYLRVAAAANLGISFSPLYLVGNISLEGELHLFTVGIEAHGSLTVEAPEPTLIYGEVCGKVDFFFFSVKGCVPVSIGSGSHILPAPILVNGVWLQSHAPVLTAGQGGDRPIDASLGDAVMLTSKGELPLNSILPVVPIDSVIVIQFHASPLVENVTTFTEPLKASCGLALPDGWVNVGGGRQVRYHLKEISLSPPLVLSPGVSEPPATWRMDRSPGPVGSNTNIDLALFSRCPVTAERALERSTDLNVQIHERWSGLCGPVAPPSHVLWTFCGQTLGPSGKGWNLNGTPQPDPPGTNRTAPVPMSMYVEEPGISSDLALHNQLLAETYQPFWLPAKIIGMNSGPLIPNWQGVKICVDFYNQENGMHPNPMEVDQFQFLTKNYEGIPERYNYIQKGSFTGLLTNRYLEIKLPEPASAVNVVLYIFGDSWEVTAFAVLPSGQLELVGSAKPYDQNNKVEVTLKGDNISVIHVEVPRSEGILLGICYIPMEQIVEDFSYSCARALQLPYLECKQGTVDPPLDSVLEDAGKALASKVWIRLHTGLSTKVILFLAVARCYYDKLLIRQLDAKGVLLHEGKLASFKTTHITGVSDGLPAEWIDPAGPWKEKVSQVVDFMKSFDFLFVYRLVVTLVPEKTCTTIELCVPDPRPINPPQLVVGVVSACSQAEINRVVMEETIQSSQIDTLTEYLNGGDSVALLQKDTNYTLVVRYDADSKAEDGSVTTETELVQRFKFITDKKPPVRLDPYVLCTSPAHQERFFFYKDTIHVVFNDIAIVQLYAAYGKQLRATLHAANGTAIQTYTISTLDPLDATITTPYREALNAMLAAGELPCVGENTINLPHGTTTLPFPLSPLMSYTLDIELDPPDNAPSPPEAVTPLFRRSFTTGKFASLADLCAELGGCTLRHRALNSELSGLSKGMVPDCQIQDSLIAAGEQALPAAGIPSITIYWAQSGGANTYTPHAIMVDTTEPIWRTRTEPIVETVPDQDDPAFKRVIPEESTSLEVIEKDTTIIDRFVYSPGGTRTLAILKGSYKPPSTGTTLKLAAHRSASTLYNIFETTVELVSIYLTSQAPWEDDHV